MNEQKQATPAEELRRQFMDHSTPLNEAGHWARRRIEQLEAASETENQIDNPCTEGDGCPTEIAVLKREWRRLKADREKLLQLLDSASEVIGRFVSDEGWAQSDMDTMDNIDTVIARMRRPRTTCHTT